MTLLELLFDGSGGWSDGEAAESSAANFARHEVADLAHRFDDLIEGDEVLVVGESHIDAGKSVGGSHDVFA